MLYHIVAMAENRVIGKDNRLPWHFPSDLRNFKRLTTGHTVLMGRKTFESIGKPLPQRQNFVLSRTARPSAGNPRFFTSLEEALSEVSTEHCFIIGGADLFRQTIHQIHGIYLTRIEACYEGDAFYTEIPPQFKETSQEQLQASPLIRLVYLEAGNLG